MKLIQLSFLSLATLFIFSCSDTEKKSDNVVSDKSTELELSVKSIAFDNGFVQFRSITKGDQLITVGLSDKLDTLLFVSNDLVNSFSDTIFDVNADGRKDYVFSIYPTNGCCPRQLSFIYLNDGKTLLAEEPIEVENAGFVAGKIYTMEYGFPEEIVAFENSWRDFVLFPTKSLALNIEPGDEKISKPKFHLMDLIKGGSTFNDSIPAGFESIYAIDWLKLYEK